RQNLFGEIHDGQMILNDAGLLIRNWWLKIPDKFQSIELGEHIIMPDHLHGIINILDAVGEDPYVRPPNNENNAIVGADPRVCPIDNGTNIDENVDSSLQNTNNVSLPQIVQWFKSMSTTAYIKGVKENNFPRFKDRLWERNYYEHIIRNEKENIEIMEYMRNNPLSWELKNA
ncbi:MAG: transposase, partial [Chloroflexota bacterium]